MTVAVITGASEGLGREYVDAVVEKFPKIDEIWLISRTKEKLQAVADQYPQKKFKIIPMDLSTDDDLLNFRTEISHFNPDIKLLINDAGFLNPGEFINQDYSAQRTMLGVNALAPTLLTNIVLKYMKPSSLIVNVCSISSFAPIKRQSIYSSTKAYIYSLSLSLHWELRKEGIKLLVMCPGNMKTSMYNNSAHLANEKKNITDRLPFLDMHVITRKSLELVQKGYIVYTPGLFYKAYRLVAKELPHALLARFLKV